jgi:hypothetical protein
MGLGDHLDAGAAAGIISPEQARDLKRYIAAREGADAAGVGDGDGDAEQVRFARGFHDVFLTIGLVILMVGIVATAGIVIGTSAGFVGAGAAWLLAESYARARRLVLPSIALAAGFVLMVAVASGSSAQSILDSGTGAGEAPLPWSVLVGALAGLAASAGFLARFGLPFAMGLVAASATASLAALAEVAAPSRFDGLLQPLLFVAGAASFAAAMIHDLSDPGRRTPRADNAFWLHLVAAPLIVHSVAGAITGQETDLTFGQAGAVLGVLSGLGLVALIIDRRALLVAGLAYLGVAVAVLVRGAAIDTGSVLAITLLVVGTAVVLLGTGWRTARRAVVETLVPPRIAASLPTLRDHPHE